MKTILSILISLFTIILNAQCLQSFSTHYNHSLALKNDGTIWSWGSNNSGELGYNSGSGIFYTPQKIGNENNWAKIFTGGNKSFVIKNNGTLWACGSGSFGGLGTGNQSDKFILTQIGTDTNWDYISAGAGTLALKTDGTLWGWGANIYGMLNLGVASLQMTPIQISTETDWAKVVAGSHHTLAIKTDGTLWACGLNDKGQLGDGTFTDRFNFIQIGTESNWVDLGTGSLFDSSVAIKADGTLWGWGSNLNNIFGFGSSIGEVYLPTQLGTATNWAKVAVGYYTVVALKTDGTFWINYPTGFIQIGTDTNWESIYSGIGHFFGMKTDGTLWGQGNNTSGQLGLGSTIQLTTVPTQLNCSEFLGIEEINASKTIKIYPNPTTEILFVENSLEENIKKVTLTDLTDKIILEKKDSFSKINMQNFENGIYILIISSENRNYIYKVVKE